jgi:signal transduction histidine kinase
MATDISADMSARVTVDPAEREIYRDYERGRRLHLAGILLPVLALIQFGVFLVSVLFLLFLAAQYTPLIRQIFAVNTALVGVCALLHMVGIRFVRRGQVTAATMSVIVPVGITVVVPILGYDAIDRSALSSASPIVSITVGEMVGTFVLIVLVGLLAADGRLLAGTTFLMNAFIAFILATALQVPGAGEALRDEAVLLVSFPLLVQWAVAGLLFAAGGTYLTTLRELGDVRVAYTRAQQLDELKDQFIVHVNHELRGPVMALQGHVELLLLTEETLSPEERRTYLTRAKRAGDTLVALVKSILAVQRLEREADSYTPEGVPIAAAVEAATRLVDPAEVRRAGQEGQPVERELRVRIPAGLQAWAEPVRVRQILTNLLSNAIKYSPPDTPVEVTATIVTAPPAGTRQARRWHERAWGLGRDSMQRPMLEIAVRDHGLGIPPNEIPLLFKRFVRLPRDLASSVPGNGLGLYLCRAYAEAMGGSIGVESTGIEGDGAVFRLRLPALPDSHVEVENNQG